MTSSRFIGERRGVCYFFGVYCWPYTPSGKRPSTTNVNTLAKEKPVLIEIRVMTSISRADLDDETFAYDCCALKRKMLPTWGKVYVSAF